jgi:2-polyprenyl-3-methyl-5-hydroxy-6-metoxy-1,4-benzoquinol methylase
MGGRLFRPQGAFCRCDGTGKLSHKKIHSGRVGVAHSKLEADNARVISSTNPSHPQDDDRIEMLSSIQYRILKKISPEAPDCCGGDVYKGKSKLEILMGKEFFAKIAGKVIIDFGCGEGTDSVDMAGRGAQRVIGIDIREDFLQTARQKALSAGVQDICVFAFSTNEAADVIVSVDAFEHFADPAEILRTMSTLLHPAGEVLVSFGPTWYHPLGGHLFSVFPWAHLMFSEEAMIRWRSTFRTDGATRFSEVAGGLNQMTIAKFEELIAASPFQFAGLELVPIRRLRFFHNHLTREFTTAIVRCRLVKRT